MKAVNSKCKLDFNQTESTNELKMIGKELLGKKKSVLKTKLKHENWNMSSQDWQILFFLNFTNNGICFGGMHLCQNPRVVWKTLTAQGLYLVWTSESLIF